MPAAQEYWFDHEKLDVYQDAIAFSAWLADIMEDLLRVGEVRDQLDRVATSIALNIAEGNGKYSLKDRCRFLDTAHGSALECAAGLDLLVGSDATWQGAPATNRPHALGTSQTHFDSRLQQRKRRNVVAFSYSYSYSCSYSSSASSPP